MLQSKRWRHIGSILRNFHNGCQACGTNGKTEVHHAHYNTLGQERPTDLVLLCPDCHESVHDYKWPAEEIEDLRTENPSDLWGHS